MSREICLLGRRASGLCTIVDDEDYERCVYGIKWYPHFTKSTVYAYALIPDEMGKKKWVHLHRFLLQPPRGIFVDHVNHNGLDNRRSNLRLATPSQNAMNIPQVTGCISKYKGVSYHRQSKKWRSQITVNGHTTEIGRFRCEEDSAIAYDVAARRLFGEFACLNFPGAVYTDADVEMRKPRRRKTSKYRGVHWLKSHSQWRAVICVNRKNIVLGTFEHELDAALAYDCAARKYHLDKAVLNLSTQALTIN